MQTETKLTARLTKSWRAMGAEVLNVTGSMFQATGWPDVFVCHKHWSGWQEHKGPTTVIQPHQERIFKALVRTENAWIIRFLDQVDDMWEIEISDLCINHNFIYRGTDGQVASQLLRTLARLDS